MIGTQVKGTKTKTRVSTCPLFFKEKGFWTIWIFLEEPECRHVLNSSLLKWVPLSYLSSCYENIHLFYFTIISIISNTFC